MTGLLKSFGLCFYYAALLGYVSAFAPMSRQHQAFVVRQGQGQALFAIRIIGKHFQLEELEDKETCTTDLYFEDDNTIKIGETDGPLSVKASGSWKIEDDSTITLYIERTFGAGSSSTDATGIGEFEFTVKRKMSGEMTVVGDHVAATGSIINEDVGEIGFFNLIDTTQERQSLNMKDRGQTS